MTLLLDATALARRRTAAAGGLGPLAASLAAELAPLVATPPAVPTRKARLTRAGGRCAADGALLRFDPWSPDEHRCDACGRAYRGDEHDRYWLLGYQLWLAERAVHAALLHALLGEPAHAALADAILDGYADQYLRYPNEDNVLGPTRPFFSTYLESIWLLQLCVALDLREQGGIAPALAGRVRDDVVAPSRALIASYDERTSNRQVWNDAALLAAARLLGDDRAADHALHAPSGLVEQLDRSLLADGTWYEGENYHLFAHRGLWYGVVMAEAAGAALPEALVERFERGFVAPFLSALPDYTFPSRRDSQYGVSLRQWRFAELCELGLARRDEPILAGALHRLYADDVARRETGRARSTAEAERNEPASALGRADLGWRSLLFAREQLPPSRPHAARSVLLADQGLAVFRRDGGRSYAALDYGHSGGGHGHPDRLNVHLAAAGARWLDDPGTGSYVDPSLHWYRSTLAHCAPLVNGRSQARQHGRLLSYDERDAAGWAEAEAAELAPGVTFRRALVMMPDYLVDELRWTAPAGTVVDLPLHVDARFPALGAWERAEPGGGAGPEDGFGFLRDAERAAAPAGEVLRFDAGAGTARLDGWVVADGAPEWWRALAPGVPGAPERRFHWLRVTGQEGVIRTVLSWAGGVASVHVDDARILVRLADGSEHEHQRHEGGWRVGFAAGGGRSSVQLDGALLAAGPPPRLHDASALSATPHPIPARLVRSVPAPFVRELGVEHYRRSELAWADAGRPRATVALALDGGDLVVDVEVRKSDPVAFATGGVPNELDNEHRDVNSDGVQLHVLLPDRGHVGGGPAFTWLVVPDPAAPGCARVTARTPGALPLEASARQIAGGYAVRCRLALPERLRPAAGGEVPIALDVIVNEMPPWRERRRGQLVLSGGGGEFVYLRGDRQPVEHLLPFLLADG